MKKPLLQYVEWVAPYQVIKCWVNLEKQVLRPLQKHLDRDYGEDAELFMLKRSSNYLGLMWANVFSVTPKGYHSSTYTGYTRDDIRESNRKFYESLADEELNVMMELNTEEQLEQVLREEGAEKRHLVDLVDRKKVQKLLATYLNANADSDRIVIIATPEDYLGSAMYNFRTIAEPLAELEQVVFDIPRINKPRVLKSDDGNGNPDEAEDEEIPDIPMENFAKLVS